MQGKILGIDGTRIPGQFFTQACVKIKEYVLLSSSLLISLGKFCVSFCTSYLTLPRVPYASGGMRTHALSEHSS